MALDPAPMPPEARRAEIAEILARGVLRALRNAHARWMLLESARACRQPPLVGPPLSRRQEGLPRAVKELSWRAQQRLCRKHHRMRARGLHENKIMTAVAREICAFLWELQTNCSHGKLPT